MAFQPRTWADRPDFEGHPLELVPCPGCGRRTHADVIEDLRGVPGTVLRGRDLEWACDGCRARLTREGGWKRSDLVEKQGAPPDHVHEHRIRERAREMRRADARASRPHVHLEAHESARAELEHPAPESKP